MRRIATCVAIGLVMTVTACSSHPGPITTGVPEEWYAEVADAIADQPEVGSVALMDNGGPCNLRDAITVDGTTLTRVLDHGVVRLGGDIPAVVCSWYQEKSAQITVARADDDAGYARLVDGTAPFEQVGNVQTGREVVIGERTLQVVRTVYPTNPSAGTTFAAYYLDPRSGGRVSLQVDDTDERSAGYDEQAVAADLAGFING